MNETAQLAKFTAEMEFAKLQPQAVLMAKQCLLDWLGVALRGAHEEPAPVEVVSGSEVGAGTTAG